MVIDVRWGSATHQGRVRHRNEDALLAGPDVFAVADGMGGHAGGEVASAIAVAGLADLDDLTEVDDPAGRLTDALARINAEILRRAREDRTVAGMGTTVAGIARASGTRVIVFNLGDSRVYRLRTGELEQLTEDHSVVGEMVRRGELTEDEARRHPRRNVVTRALGAEDDIRPVVTVLDARVGDCFLVASDGLFDEVPEPEIGDILATPGPVERRARALLDAALRRGGRDNVSVVVVAIAGTNAADGLEVDTSPSRSAPSDTRATPARRR
jgi:serine/threonine protein phosphatase PrpC